MKRKHTKNKEGIGCNLYFRTNVFKVNTAYLLLGSNIGEREKNLSLALKFLKTEAGTVYKKSAIYSTKAWGNETMDDFLNRAVCMKTKLSAAKLLKAVLKIESGMGRKRQQRKYLPRTIDIDILFFNDEIINSGELKIPHPLLHQRKFALVPMAEIAPGFVHPVFHKTISFLLSACEDTLSVAKIN